MKKLHELLGQPLCEGDLGVEIECEGKGIKLLRTETWNTERDGSLRGEFPSECAEFVMAKPVKVAGLHDALEELIDFQKKAEFTFSFRTSVHVHVNVQTLTEPEMLAFLYLCLLLEEPLMSFCGESRKGNRFCLRYADAEGYDRTLDSLFSNGARVIHMLDGDKIRYAAINIHALKKYGSIEFRGMRGNMDMEVIKPWCETLIHIREKARELGTPIAVYNKYISMSNEEFVSSMLGVHSDLFKYEGSMRDVERSFSLTLDLPHTFKNRRIEEPKAVNAAPPPPRVKKVAVPAFQWANHQVDPNPIFGNLVVDREEIARRTTNRFNKWFAINPDAGIARCERILEQIKREEEARWVLGRGDNLE